MLLNAERASALMKEASLDLLIAGSPENVYYVSGLRSLGQWLVGSVVLSTLTSQGASAVVAPVSDMDLVVEGSPWADQIIPYGTFYIEGEAGSDEDRRLLVLGVGQQTHGTPLEALLAVLAEGNWATGRTGVDEQGIAPALLDGLRAALPQTELVRASDLFREIRKVKTVEERRRLGRAVEVTERAFLAALEEAREGVTERELAVVYEGALARDRANPVFTVIGFGPHGAYPNAIPGDRRLRRGDVIRFDIGCQYQGYFADIARTAVFGTPRDEVAPTYKAILEGQERGLEAVRAGARASEIFDAAVRGTQRGGLPGYRRNHVGHGIGLKVYDLPLLGPRDEERLEEGMVINVETPYYVLGMAGLQVEDTVVVTADGYVPLTRTSRELYVL